MFITVKYSCKECGIVNRDVIMPARKDESEPIEQYMKQVVEDCLCEDHARKSPRCKTQNLSDIMIPLSEGKAIGCV